EIPAAIKSKNCPLFPAKILAPPRRWCLVSFYFIRSNPASTGLRERLSMRADVRSFKYHFSIIAGVTLFAVSCFGNPQASQSSAFLAQAYELTAKGDLNGAEAAYQQMIQVDPHQGYPAMARFLHRTGQTTATQNLLQSPGLAA